MEDQGGEGAGAVRLLGDGGELHGLAVDGDGHHRPFLRRGRERRGEQTYDKEERI